MSHSKYYVENWKQANKWLHKNAPEYVIKCIEEMAEVLYRQHKELKKIDRCVKLVEQSNKDIDQAVKHANMFDQVLKKITGS